MSSQNSSEFDPEGLQDYFTDVEALRDLFKSFVAAPTLPKRLLVIHGVGGVGKSTLLRMFRLHCKSDHVPAALTSRNDGNLSVVTLLSDWADQLDADGLELKTFAKTLKRYHVIETKIDKRIHAAQDDREKLVDVAGKATSKLAETAGGAAAGALIGSILPGVGTVAGSALGGILGGIGADVMVDWMKGFLAEPDIELLLDPARKMTGDFLKDIAKITGTKRLVLMLDDYEQMTALDSWIRDFVPQVHQNVLLVMAGRSVPAWEWISRAHVEELKPMGERDMRTLVRRYYRKFRGDMPDPAQVDSIVRFARGMPMAVTAVVQLWARYQYEVENLDAVKPMVLADLVDRLMEGVPKEIIPALEAAASVRWFNKEILHSVTGQEVTNAVYNELRLFPFVHPHTEGLVLHDTVRETMDENLKVHDRSRHELLHGRAAAYFGNSIRRSGLVPGLSDEWQRMTLEQIYHLLKTDENAGIDLLHVAFGQSLAYYRYEFCRALLVEADQLALRNARSLFRLKYNQCRLTAAEFSPAYVTDHEFHELVVHSDSDPAIKWEVLFNYALFQDFAAEHEQRVAYLEKSLAALRATQPAKSQAECVVLAELASALYGMPTRAEELAKQAVEISEAIGDSYLAYKAHVELGHLYLSLGQYTIAETAWQAALVSARQYQNDSLIAGAFNRIAQALMAQGKMSEAKATLDQAAAAASRLPDTLGAGRGVEMYIKRHFAIWHQLAGEYDEAIELYRESAQLYRERRSTVGRLRTLVLLAACLCEAGYCQEIEALRTEIESLTPKLRSHEVVVSWLVVEGHLLMDDSIARHIPTDRVLAKYEDALVNALNYRITVLDETVNRILWKMGLLITAGHTQEVFAILNDLISFWRNGMIHDVPLAAVEHEKRQRLIEASQWAGHASQVVEQFESALKQNEPLRRPSFWLGY